MRPAPAWKLIEPVMVWFRLTECLSDADIAEARALLSGAERARCDQFLFEHDRRDFAAAHALLRSTLTLHGGLPLDSWQFGTGVAGKPFLVGASELEFNIAHTNGLVACALSMTGPIGVDVEGIGHARSGEDIAESYFAESEILLLRSFAKGLERQTRFTELWTLKEAYLKGVGSGLHQPLNQFGFELGGGSKLHFSPPAGSAGTNWRFGLFAPFPNYRLATAVRTNRSIDFNLRMWPPENRCPHLVPLRMSHTT